jgi:histidine triad (HIT) family protein
MQLPVSSCVFCRILAGLEPASFVYTDELAAAFMDINPVTRGHALVVPRAHVVDIYEASDELAAAMFVVAARLARAMKGALGCDGVNFWMANEPPAGQVVMHAHLHVIPRYVGDGFGLRRGSTGRASRAELDELAQRLSRALEAKR